MRRSAASFLAWSLYLKRRTAMHHRSRGKAAHEAGTPAGCCEHSARARCLVPELSNPRTGSQYEPQETRMSSYGIHVPAPDEINYHEAQQAQRVARAKALIDAGDVLSILDSRIAAEADPKVHPLYPLVQFYLDREPAVHGGEFFDRCKQMVLAAIDTAIDDALEVMED